MDIEMFLTPGLGDATWMVASDGAAALIDPQRDARRFLDAADQRGWRITHVLETHVHNDYLTGALEVRAATGAEIVVPARGGYRFAHRAVEEGASITVGSVALVAMATPGHTPEHLAWQVLSDGSGAPEAVLTGGSLIVGGAGRTDLLGDDRTEELTEEQFRSMRRLARLPDSVRVLPTHGAGSFCSAGPAGGDRWSTMARERTTNLLLQTTERARFQTLMLGGLGRYPAYYAHMAAINREGPPSIRCVRTPVALPAALVADLRDRGIWVIDARGRRSYGAGHVAGSIHVAADESFVSWVGSVVPFGAAIVLVLPTDDGDLGTDLVVDLSRIGYDAVVGVLDGGIDGWVASGRPLEILPMSTVADVDVRMAAADPVSILDVRQPTEWRDGTIPGSTAIFLGDLAGQVGTLDRDRTWLVMCASGVRAAIGASLLARTGLRAEVVAAGGVPDWLATHPASTDAPE